MNLLLDFQFYSIDLSLSVLLTVSGFDYYSIITSLKAGSEFSQLYASFQNYFDHSRSIKFPYAFQDQLSISAKKTVEISIIGTVLTL